MSENQEPETTKTIETQAISMCSWPGCERDQVTAVEVRGFLQRADGSLIEAYIKHEGDEEPAPLIIAVPSCNLHNPLIANEALVPIINTDGEVLEFHGHKEADFLIAVIRGLAVSDQLAELEGVTPLGYINIQEEHPTPTGDAEASTEANEVNTP